ncbi:erv26 super protein [Blyttiomyces sp. JEL0837]|nr:erv26 super protein [Blyttiomyces sp. JEL0837]
MVADGFPVVRTLISLGCHGVYSLLLEKFPNIQLEDPIFIATCVLVIFDHFLWFFFFTHNYHRFSEIATFFGIIVWLIPFMYFISLSANEYTLPAIDPSASQRERGGRQKKTNLVKGLINFVLQKKDELLPSQTAGGRKDI